RPTMPERWLQRATMFGCSGPMALATGASCPTPPSSIRWSTSSHRYRSRRHRPEAIGSAFPIRHDNGQPCLLPCSEAAKDVLDRFEPHVLRGLGRKRGAPAAGAKEHEALAGREESLVIGAFRIDPEFEHAAR